MRGNKERRMKRKRLSVPRNTVKRKRVGPQTTRGKKTSQAVETEEKQLEGRKLSTTSQNKSKGGFFLLRLERGQWKVKMNGLWGNGGKDWIGPVD